MTTRYEALAQRLETQIDQGVLRPGERLPGVRRLARQHGVSASTVVAALHLLEDTGRIEVRPRSGHYVRPRLPGPTAVPAAATLPGEADTGPAPTPVSGPALALRLVKAVNRPNIVQLGAAVPHTDLLPTRAVNRALADAARRHRQAPEEYAFPPGLPELRRQLALRMAEAGCPVGPDQVVVTSGCQQAIALSLRAVTRAGDVVAVESPTFYGLLQVIEALGLTALEVPTHPEQGISLPALELALSRWPVGAVALTPSFGNPLGHCMGEAQRRDLAALLAQHDVPLVENDIYGDLGFADPRPRAAKAHDTEGRVLYCASFSKTLAPGLRVGWVAPGRYQQRVEYLKYVLDLATPTLPQIAVADLLAHGGYARLLRSLRRRYAAQVARMAAAVTDTFPAGTRVSRPAGGFVLWVTLPEGVDAMALHRDALTAGISVAPGPMFSASGRYANCLRLNCALPWDAGLEEALATLAGLTEKAHR